MRSVFLSFLVLGATLGATAQSTADDHFQLLVPLAFAEGASVSGAYGTAWIGEVWGSNDSMLDIQTLQTQQCQMGCPEPQLPAKSQRTLGLQTGQSIDAGALLYVPSDLAEDVRFSARVLEITRRAQPTGFAVPVVREPEYLEAPVVIPGVPRGSSIRSSLRIYDPSGHGGRSFVVELFDDSDATLGSFFVTLAEGRFIEATPVAPGYAAVHDLEMKLGDEGKSVYHVRVSPTEDAPYWAFVSVTDNETQHVLVITAD